MTMAPKDHLTPTPVVDKNGKWTTVYRKLFGSKKNAVQPAPVPVVPAPVAAPKAPPFDRAPTIENLRIRAEKSLQEVGQIRTMYQAYEQIKAYPDDLLQRLNKAIDDDVPNLWMVDRLIGEALPQSRISEALYFLPRMDKPLLSVARKHLRSLHAYKQLPVSGDYSQESEEVRQQCLALMNVGQAALWVMGEDEAFDGTEENAPYVFKDDGLTNLVLEYADREAEISNIIEDRKTVDPDIIRTILSSDAPALSEGML